MYTRSCPVWVLGLIPLLVGGTAQAADKNVPEVAVTRPLVREVTDHEDFTGRTEAAARVELRARATGYLTAVHFQDGDAVKQGDLLFEIDPRPYQAQLNQALAQIELHKATLQAARATLARSQALARAGQGNVNQQQLDQDQAAVAEAAARLKVAEASADLAKLNLGFCKVAAPFSGQIGQRRVVPGDLVQQDQTLLAVLVSDEPLHVHFQCDERTFLRLRRALLAGKEQPGKLPVAVGLTDEEEFPHPGQLDFTANRVDPATGSISLRATLARKDRLLVPGLFVRVRLALGAPYKALLIDDRAIASDEGRKYVYVLDPDSKVEQRPVKIGTLHDGLRVITEGLKPDDRVIPGRLTGLRPGMSVQPKKAEGPAPKAPPPPEEGAGFASARGQTGPGILVETTYAGADAQTVSDSVRSPIEQQVSGVENLRYLRSRCTSDGKYALALAFAPGVDLGLRQVLVQNRVALATPQLPREVQEAGVNVRRGTAGVLLIVSLSSPEGKYDPLYLGNYASIQIKDELSRVAGVGEVALLGAREYGMRIWLDPDRLAAFNLNAGDVTGVLRKEKQDALDPETLANLIVRTDGAGRAVHLRDVARVELGASGPRSEAFQDGVPVVALAIHLTGDAAPEKVRAALGERLAAIRGRLPDGLVLDVSFDFTANLAGRQRAPGVEYILLDLDFAAAAGETAEVLKRIDTLLRQLRGVQRVLALSENSFDLFGGRACLLVQLIPPAQRKTDRDEIMQAIRTRLGEQKDVTVRLRVFAAPGCLPRCGYPIDLALHGPDAAEVRAWATRLADRLRRTQELTDVWMNTDSAPRPRQVVEVDRARAAALGVAVADVFHTLEVFTGAVPVNQFSRFGRTWRVEVQAGVRANDRELLKLKVRNARGQMVALGSIATLREAEAPRALDFLDLRPMVELTANAGPGVATVAGRELCEKLAEEVRKDMGLAAAYRLTWLHDLPAGK